jgi:hypothetical protein
VRVAAAVVLRQRGDDGELGRVEDAVRQAQAQHERILRRRHVKETVELVEEHVGALGRLAARGVARDQVPGIEAVPGALGFLFLDQRLARGDEALPRRLVNALGAGRNRWGSARALARGGKAAAQAVEVALLFFVEIHGA